MTPESDAESEIDIQLMHLTGTGDRAAFSRLYDRLSGVLFATAWDVLKNREAAEDVLQDAFLSIWEKAPLYSPLRGKPVTWAIVLTRNKAIDRFRSLQRRRGLHDKVEREELTAAPFDDRDPPSAIITSERAALVRGALKGLTADQREAIELTYLQHLTQDEAAAKLGEPLSTIKARIRRGMMRLREVLEGKI